MGIPLDVGTTTYLGVDMTINALHCSLSIWNGLEGYCRWCDKEICPGTSNKRRWCSGECLTSWRTQHRYYLARQELMRRSRGRCSCLRQAGEERHVLCAGCGKCQSQVALQGSIMTCDHKVPRFGNKEKFSCMHHQSNLQVLCTSCHTEKSRRDELLFGL